MQRMRVMRWMFAGGLLAASLGGAPPITPPPPSRSIFDKPTAPPPRVWDQIQDPLDRSTGRIVDEPSYQLDRLQRERDADRGLIPPQREADRLREELERRMRIEQQQQDRQREFANERQRQAELDRREYDLFINAGISPLSLQVMADQQALRDAQAERNQRLLQAQETRTQALNQRPADRAQIEAEYQQQVEQIRADYQHRRETILGFPPATAPSTQPSEP
jgi:hypothetical protein